MFAHLERGIKKSWSGFEFVVKTAIKRRNRYLKCMTVILYLWYVFAANFHEVLAVSEVLRLSGKT